MKLTDKELIKLAKHCTDNTLKFKTERKSEYSYKSIKTNPLEGLYIPLNDLEVLIPFGNSGFMILPKRLIPECDFLEGEVKDERIINSLSKLYYNFPKVHGMLPYEISALDIPDLKEENIVLLNMRDLPKQIKCINKKYFTWFKKCEAVSDIQSHTPLYFVDDNQKLIGCFCVLKIGEKLTKAIEESV